MTDLPPHVGISADRFRRWGHSSTSVHVSEGRQVPRQDRRMDGCASRSHRRRWPAATGKTAGSELQDGEHGLPITLLLYSGVAGAVATPHKLTASPSQPAEDDLRPPRQLLQIVGGVAGGAAQNLTPVPSHRRRNCPHRPGNCRTKR